MGRIFALLCFGFDATSGYLALAVWGGGQHCSPAQSFAAARTIRVGGQEYYAIAGCNPCRFIFLSTGDAIFWRIW